MGKRKSKIGRERREGREKEREAGRTERGRGELEKGEGEREREKGWSREGRRKGLDSAGGSGRIFNVSLRLNGTVLRQQVWLLSGPRGTGVDI